MWFYWLASKAVDVVSAAICRRVVEGRENVPADGPLILVSNHLSLVDPPLLGAVFPRPIRFMAKEELFHAPIVQWVVAGYRAFPIRRGEADRQALQTTLRLLKQGEVVGIFPEGTRSRRGAMTAAHQGVALIALRSGAPLIPVGIAGTEQIFRCPRSSLRPAVVVRIGRPFHLEPTGNGTGREALAGHTDRIMREIAALVPPPYRGIYASVAGVAKPV